MLPLMRYLLGGDRNRVDPTHRSNLAFIEGITTRFRLKMDGRKIRAYSATRKCVRPKSIQLRMAPIPSCLPAQNRPCQQRFAPQRNQALRIEVLRMDCPESHIAGWRLTMRLNDTGMQCPQTKLISANHRLPPWPTEDATPRSLDANIREFPVPEAAWATRHQSAKIEFAEQSKPEKGNS
jgi:hypothetical protein